MPADFSETTGAAPDELLPPLDGARAFYNPRSGLVHIGAYPYTPGHDAFTLCARDLARFESETGDHIPIGPFVPIETADEREGQPGRPCASCFHQYRMQHGYLEFRAQIRTGADQHSARPTVGFAKILEGVREARSTLRYGRDDRAIAALVVIEDLATLHGPAGTVVDA